MGAYASHTPSPRRRPEAAGGVRAAACARRRRRPSPGRKDPIKAWVGRDTRGYGVATEGMLEAPLPTLGSGAQASVRDSELNRV